MQQLKKTRINRYVVPRFIIMLLGTYIFLAGCSSELGRYSSFTSIPNQKWSADNHIDFILDSATTANFHDFELTIRHGDNYPHANIWLYIDYVDTANNVIRQKIEYILSDDGGRWKGKGFGSTYEYRTIVTIPDQAKAINKIIFWQGMNLKILSGISDIGITF